MLQHLANVHCRGPNARAEFMQATPTHTCSPVIFAIIHLHCTMHTFLNYHHYHHHKQGNPYIKLLCQYVFPYFQKTHPTKYQPTVLKIIQSVVCFSDLFVSVSTALLFPQPPEDILDANAPKNSSTSCDTFPPFSSTTCLYRVYTKNTTSTSAFSAYLSLSNYVAATLSKTLV